VRFNVVGGRTAVVDDLTEYDIVKNQPLAWIRRSAGLVTACEMTKVPFDLQRWVC
jgi:hypothetical protein